ncbi:MAG: hypothetical protein KGR26_16015, partial [Cyanobacteria bacterium REEB65]|nr:hypothetical protein [Cyanobacteria bacterium REEB65]
TGIADIPMGPVTGTVNVGYSRTIKGMQNIGSANIAFSGPVGSMTWYEEQFVNYPVSGFSNGGIRASLQIPLSSAFSFDIDPAMLYTGSGAGTTWSFNPQLGLDLTF